MSQELKQQSFGNFEAVGTITVLPDTFQVDLKGKNNPNWNYSTINMKMEDDKGGMFFLNAADGFSMTNGRIIYANVKDSKEQMQVSFADRNNPSILEHIDNRSFISVALRLVEGENGRKQWEYNNFLTLYDVINFIKDRFETGMKLRVRGRTRYRMYNDEISKDFEIQSIFLLPEEDTSPLGFTFNQNVVLKPDSVDVSEWDEKGLANVKAYIYTTPKDKVTKQKYAEVLTLPMVVRSTDENKDKMKRMIDKFLIPEDGKARRIRLEGKYNNGYVQSQVTEDDLPQEAQELIEDGLYSKEEVFRMYANRDRVSEMLIVRPVINVDSNTQKPRVDYSDDEYTLEDLITSAPEAIDVDVPWDNDKSSDDDDLSFLNDLE